MQYPNDDAFFNWEEGEYFTPPTTTCLNIEPSEGSSVNGMLFVCSKEELEYYDEREFTYDRIEINDLLEDVSIMGGKAYAYTAKPAYFRPSEEELPQTTVIPLFYIQVIEKALYRLGKDFAIEYHESTQSLPYHLIF